MDLEPNGRPSGETEGRHLWRKNSKSYRMEAGKGTWVAWQSKKLWGVGSQGAVFTEEECGSDFVR